MKKTLGIIFSNIHDANLGELTARRTLAALPFAGRYRQFDFTVSNMVNSGIYEIGVVAKYNYQSLMAHISSQSQWDLDRKNGGLIVLPPFGMGQTTVYESKMDALYGAREFLEKSNNEYVVISDSHVLCNIDFAEVVDRHVDSKADITVVVNQEEPSEAKHDLVFTTKDGEVVDIATNSAARLDTLSGMGMYIVKRDYLLKLIDDAYAHGERHFEQDIVQKKFKSRKLKIDLFVFRGVVLRNDSIQAYFENNLKLLKPEIRNGLFVKKTPIYTRDNDSAPTTYAPEAEVGDSIIANGCIVEGQVKRSVIFRDVVIEKGCNIENCIIMQGTRVRAGAVLKNAIIDTNCIITAGSSLIGARVAPIIIRKGLTI